MDRNGEQYRLKNYTLDFFCQKCQIGYMVEGLYKVSNCIFHPSDPKKTFYSDKKSIKDRELRSNMIRQNILNICKGRIKSIQTINECCLSLCNSQKDFNNFFKYLKLKDSKTCFNNLQIFKESFNIELFKDLNPQKTILSPLITPINLSFVEKKGNGLIQKYDVNQAYLSSIISEKFVLPVGSPKKLVGKEAQLFVDQNIINGKKVFALCKVLILPYIKDNSLTKLPFFSLKVKRNNEYTSVLSACRTCSENQSLYKCHHTERQREFIVECLSDDLIFALSSLQYRCKVLSLVYFDKQVPFVDLSDLSKKLYNLRRKSLCDAQNFCIKQIILCGLGRFALQTTKCVSYSRQLFSLFELEHSLNSNQIESYDVIYDICIAKFKALNFKFDDILKKSIKTNICSVVFSKISNQLRRNVYEISLQILSSKNLSLLRIDVDSILIRRKKTIVDFQNLIDILTSIDGIHFKLELDNISKYISLKKRSFAMQTEHGPLIKCPGLKMSFKKRHSININEIINHNINKVSCHK